MSDFIKQLKRIVNTGQSGSIVLCGNIYDLFQDKKDWVPLIPYLVSQCKVDPNGKTRGITFVVYRLNNPIEVIGDLDELSTAYQLIAGTTLRDRLEESGVEQAQSNTVYAFQLLRQMSEAMRLYKDRKNNLIIVIEAADVRVPECELSRMNPADRFSVGIFHDWFSDPTFMTSGDTVLLLAESRSDIHHRISRLPQVVSVEVGLPSIEERDRYIKDFPFPSPYAPKTLEQVAESTSGLSIHALRQLLLSGNFGTDDIATKVEEYMTGQLGDGVVEFKRPTQTLKDVIGFRRIKKFLEAELIPAFKGGTISGAAVGGPIGGGKTFICEAVAAELGIPVITLKNIRSKWYGETDQIFERLRRLLESFHRIVIFVDEADTQFGSVEDGEQATERRLTGKIQAMMSDVQLKGKVIWFLMTARIHLLSPDIRRPGRMDLIIPILDPEGQDRDEFVQWVFGNLLEKAIGTYVQGMVKDNMENARGNNDGVPEAKASALAYHRKRIDDITGDWSAAAFSMLKSRLRDCDDIDKAIVIATDLLPPDIGQTRRYQSLQALLNCTRMSLLTDEPWTKATLSQNRQAWKNELRRLEKAGIR